jgi:hypothetical protein
MAHLFLDLRDEYESGTIKSQCGHSVMASPVGSNHNLCILTDHGRDGDPTAPPTFEPPAWQKLAGFLPTSITRTPENYNFQDHDFNNQITHQFF